MTSTLPTALEAVTAPPVRHASDVVRTMADAMESDPRTRSWDRRDWLAGMHEYAQALDGPATSTAPGQDLLDRIREHVHGLDRLVDDYAGLRSTRAGDQLLEDIGKHTRPLRALLGQGPAS